MDGHDRAGAFTAFEAALALSPPAHSPIFSAVLWLAGRRAERAINGAIRVCALAHSILGLCGLRRPGARYFHRRRYDECGQRGPISPSEPIQPTVSPTCNGRALRSSGAAKGEDGRGTGSATAPYVSLQAAILGRHWCAGSGCFDGEALSAAGLQESAETF